MSETQEEVKRRRVFIHQSSLDENKMVHQQDYEILLKFVGRYVKEDIYAILNIPSLRLGRIIWDEICC